MIPTPLRPRELAVRCVCLIQKYNCQKPNQLIKINGILFDKTKNQASSENGILTLSPTETRLLRVLMEKAGEEINSRDLLRTV